MEQIEKPPHPLRQFFKFDHLKSVELRVVSMPFADMARFIDTLPDNSEKTTALRKLLESKDCAVRAMLHEHNEQI